MLAEERGRLFKLRVQPPIVIYPRNCAQIVIMCFVDGFEQKKLGRHCNIVPNIDAISTYVHSQHSMELT